MKKATANNLTFENVAYVAYRNGIDVSGGEVYGRIEV